jgi:hypothetical protein
VKSTAQDVWSDVKSGASEAWDWFSGLF